MVDQPPLTLAFLGPYSWPGHAGAPSIFESEAGGLRGIYLWTIEQPTGDLVYYVGETGRTFAVRMEEHYREHTAGFYTLNDPNAFRSGRRELGWAGKWHPQFAGRVPCVQRWRDLAPVIDELTSTYRFFLAPLDAPSRVRQRIESALVLLLYAGEPQIADFQEVGMRVRPRWVNEEELVCRVETSAPLLGVPAEFRA
jgi:hypothetical protein